jgi:multidrug efflux pump subunit AcrA (membrane-fusion protein)
MTFKHMIASLLVLSPLFLSACSSGGAQGDAAQPLIAPSATQRAEAEETVRSVRSVVAQTGMLTAARTATVTIEPQQESRVAAGANGRVMQILVREGGRVEAGSVVMQLDDAAATLQVRNAQLALESAQINLQRAERQTGESVPQLELQLSAARTNFEIAQKQLDEGRALFEAGGISLTQLQSLEAQQAQAQAALTQAQDALARTQRAGSEDLALLRVQVDQARTQLQQAREALAETRIIAPFDGEVAEVFVEQGEFIGAGSPAFRLVSVERQRGRFAVPPQDAQALLAQREIYFRFQGLDYAATIVRSSSAPGMQRLVEMTAEIYPSDRPIPAGSVAELRYSVALASGVLIPSGAISTAGGGTFAFTVEGGRARRQPLQVVSEAGGEAVVEGIAPGTLVIFPVPADIRDGMRVEVVN